MTDTNQLPPLPEFLSDTNSINAFVESTDEQIRDAFRAYALQARAQVQGEPVYWEWRHLGNNQFAADFGQWSEWKRVEARSPIFTAEDELRTLRRYIADGYKYELRALYTAPQPAHATQAASAEDMKVYASIADRYFREATQADVADEQILEIAEPFGEFQYGDAQGHKRIDFARTILALRPAAVPMTGEQRQSAFLSAPTSSGGHRTAFMLGIQFAEAHHDITAQVKGEQ